MRSIARRVLVIILTAVAATTACSRRDGASAPRFISIATGGTGGVYYPYGGGLAKVLNEQLPGIRATAEVTAASVDNLKLIRDGRADVAFALADTVADAVAGRGAFEGFLYLPVLTPEVVAGISLLILFALSGIPLGATTIIIAHVAFCISFVVIVVLARLEGMERNLEEAAMVLGADEITAFRRVTLPQLWPGILAGALLAFTISFDDFVITSFVSGPGSSTLPIVVYGMVRRNVEPSINAISTIILLVTASLIYCADWLLRRQGRARAAAL